MSWKMALEELVAATEGKVLSQHAREYHGVGTDTRAALGGKIFIALKGDNFDAHDFLERAVASGAAALVVSRLPGGARALLEKTTVIEVGDTLKALQDLGLFWRRKMPARILGLTGSNGKTTTKEFAAALIATKHEVHYSKGSLNNHWGVPLSLLELQPKHELALIEMGMNHAGELTTLMKIAEPDAVLVTMVGRGHLEGLGSVAGVARAKEEVYAAAKPSAVRLFNLENEHTRAMYERYAPRLPETHTITFAGCEYARERGWLGSADGETDAAKEPATQSAAHAWPKLDVSLEVVSLEPESMRIRGEIRGVGGETTVPVFGRQNITNLMSAATLALAAGMNPSDIWNAFPKCHTVWGRNQWVKLPSGARVLFDGYNANPESMRAAIDNFSQLKVAGKKYAVLGEMKEMGEHAATVHRELGREAAKAGFEAISFFGPSRSHFVAGLRAEGFSKNLFESDTYEQNLAPRTLPVLEVGDIVLMKGSRGMQLEMALLDMKPLDFEAKK